MLDALVAPSAKSIVIGAVVAAAGLAVIPHHHHHHARHVRLVLEASAECDATYFTPFTTGDVTVTMRDTSDLPPLQFVTRGHYVDGCTWQGTDTLRPIDATHYAYDYSETLISCDPDGDATMTRRTPRSGVVTVLPYEGHSTRFMMWKP